MKKMSKIIRIGFFAVCVLYCQSSLYAKDGVYLGGGAGLALLTDSSETYENSAYSNLNTDTSYETGLVSSLKAGYKVKRYRFELEYFIQKNSVNTVKTATFTANNVDSSSEVLLSTLFLNVYYDFDGIKKFKPFVGVGIGNSKIDVTREFTGTTMRQSDKDTSIAFHITGGVEKKITENLSFDLITRMTHYSDIVLKDGDGDKIEQSFGAMNIALIAGLKYSF